MNSQCHPTVIAGGGFTGLFTALHLKYKNYARPIVLIDAKERFTFQPLLYEFLSNEMSASQVCPRYEALLDGHGIRFICDRIEAIDLYKGRLQLASGLDYPYDYLVLALGSVVNYFGIDGAQEYAWPFRQQDDAIALANHLRECLQQATQTHDPDERRKLLTVAFMGGGPSGVELAGTLADLLPKWYIQLGGNPDELRIVLFEQRADLLDGDINAPVRDTARTALQERCTLPVELRFEHTVKAVEPDCVRFEHCAQTETLPTTTMIWTAGVAPHPLMRDLPLEEMQPDSEREQSQPPPKRPIVTPTLQLVDFPEVFAGGDCAAEQAGILPPLAQVAYQHGQTIAHNLNALTEGETLLAADVHLRGSLLKLGLGESVAQLFNRFEVDGTPGNLIRQATYLQLLPTPAHNLKATGEWFLEEIFQRHTQSKVRI